MTTTKQLIGVGLVDAKLAQDLQPGDITVWNYGGCCRVLSVEALSPKYVRVNMVSINALTGEIEGDGRVWARRTVRTFAIGFSARMTAKFAAKAA